jgi:hypothetical protein
MTIIKFKKPTCNDHTIAYSFVIYGLIVRLTRFALEGFLHETASGDRLFSMGIRWALA